MATSGFWIDTLSALPQIVVAFYMIYRYTRAEHRYFRTIASTVLIAAVYLMSDGAPVVRAVVTAALQILLTLLGARIPKINAVIYTILSILMMFVVEFPVDLVILLGNPDFVSLQLLPPALVLTLRLICTPYFCFCYYLTWLICDKLFHRYTDRSITRYLPFFLFQSLILLVLIYLDAVAFRNGMDPRPFAISSAIIVAFIILMDLMLMRTFEQLQRTHQLELDRQQTALLLQNEAENYARLQEQSSAIRRLRHDMVNQLQAIEMLLDSGNTQTAQAQLSSYFSQVKAQSAAVFSGNAVVDAILSAKRYALDDQGIALSYEGQLPSQLDLDPVALSSIVSNLLDNAMHACAQLPPEDRHMDFSIQLHGTELLISCSNPSAEDAPAAPKAPPLSSEHGWGLTILEELAQRHGGRMEIQTASRRFRVVLWIPLAEQQEAAQ